MNKSKRRSRFAAFGMAMGLGAAPMGFSVSCDPFDVFIEVFVDDDDDDHFDDCFLLGCLIWDEFF